MAGGFLWAATAIVLLAAISSFAVKRRKGKAPLDEAEQQPEEVVA